MPGQKISEADQKNIDPKFICNVCTLLLVEPMQTPCGHLMCLVCLETLLSSPNPSCPSDGTQLRKKDIFLDAFTRREIMGLHLHCPNKDCVWAGINKDLQEHSKSCVHALIQCVHDQCKQDVKRSLLAQHLETECHYREVSCDYCDEKLQYIKLKEHVNIECAETPSTCNYCGVTGLRRRKIKQHEVDECEEIPIKCEFSRIGCDHAKEVKRKDMQRHWSDGLFTHLRLLLTIVLDLLAKVQNMMPKMELVTIVQAEHEKMKQDMEAHSTDIKGKSTVMLRTLTAVQKRVENLESKTGAGNNDSVLGRLQTKLTDLDGKYNQVVGTNRRLQDELLEKDAEITRLRERLNLVDASMAETTVRLSDLGGQSPGQTTTSCNGTLLWKIDDFNRRRREAVSGAQIATYSPHFYSSQYGYKMCARIYMNGDGFGKNTHISLFFVVMKGDYDALLPWPFQKKITMMLLDQNNGEHMIDAFRSDPESSSFQRPKNNMNVASGSPLFMALADLNNRAYVKDDTMFVKIIVD